MQGLKSQVKQFLKSHGVTTIALDNGSVVKLQRAKTSQLIKRASEFKDFIQGGIKLATVGYMSDAIVDNFLKLDGNTDTKDAKFPTDDDMKEQLDYFANMLASQATHLMGDSRWNRMVNDDGRTANIIYIYSLSGDEARKLFTMRDTYGKDAGKTYGPINLDPITFSDEVLKRIDQQYGHGDGSKAKDIQLSIEDSNVTNPFDSSDFNVQAQLAFRVTLKDSDTDEADE